jgi:Thiamin pyrophosphokinase, vitamin B1 binding domain
MMSVLRGFLEPYSRSLFPVCRDGSLRLLSVCTTTFTSPPACVIDSALRVQLAPFACTAWYVSHAFVNFSVVAIFESDNTANSGSTPSLSAVSSPLTHVSNISSGPSERSFHNARGTSILHSHQAQSTAQFYALMDPTLEGALCGLTPVAGPVSNVTTTGFKWNLTRQDMRLLCGCDIAVALQLRKHCAGPYMRDDSIISTTQRNNARDVVRGGAAQHSS